MPEKLSIQEAINILEGAFVPFRCEAKAKDYNAYLVFQIFDPEDNQLLCSVELSQKVQFSDLSRLQGIITSVKRDYLKK